MPAARRDFDRPITVGRQGQTASYPATVIEQEQVELPFEDDKKFPFVILLVAVPMILWVW